MKRQHKDDKWNRQRGKYQFNHINEICNLDSEEFISGFRTSEL